MKKQLFIYFLLFLSSQLHSQQLWLGSYTTDSKYGIRLLNLDSKNGKIQVVDSIAVPQASFLTYSKKGILYSVEEDFEGMVHAIKPNSNGKYEIFSSQPTKGAHPCYIALDQSQQWLTVGNYSSGNLSIYKINDDGSLSEPIITHQHYGKSTNKDRQEGPHVHSTVFTPDNKFLLVPDLGIDSVKVYAFDEKNGNLTPSYWNTIGFEKGGGPRHLSIHPNGKYVYVLGELNGKVEVFEYTHQQFRFIDRVSALPPNFNGSFSAADIHISNDGKHLYLSLRDQLNSIVLFDIGDNGQIFKKNSYSTGGVNPRNFYLSPDGKFLIAENQSSNSLVIFKRDQETGELEFYNQIQNIPKPVCLISK